MTFTAVKSIIGRAKRTANRVQCCLNCKHSYFLHLHESGMCSHPELTAEKPYPKYVTEFYKCPYWQKKE